MRRRDDVKFLESLVNMKLNTIKRTDLLQIASQNGIALSTTEADQIVKELYGKNYNLFNNKHRNIVLAKIAGIIGDDRAQQIEQVFLSLTGR